MKVFEDESRYPRLKCSVVIYLNGNYSVNVHWPNWLCQGVLTTVGGFGPTNFRSENEKLTIIGGMQRPGHTATIVLGCHRCYGIISPKVVDMCTDRMLIIL